MTGGSMDTSLQMRGNDWGMFQKFHHTDGFLDSGKLEPIATPHQNR